MRCIKAPHSCNFKFDQVVQIDNKTIVDICRLDSYYMRQPLKQDYIWAGLCILGAVYFMFRS